MIATDKGSNMMKLTKVMRDMRKTVTPTPSRRNSLPETFWKPAYPLPFNSLDLI